MMIFDISKHVSPENDCFVF